MERRKAKAMANAAQGKAEEDKVSDNDLNFESAPTWQDKYELAKLNGLIRRKVSELDPLAMNEEEAGLDSLSDKEEVGARLGRTEKEEGNSGRRDTVEVDPMDILGRGSIGKGMGPGLGSEVEILG